MTARVAFAVMLCAGCGISGGTATVGIWRPQRVVDTEVCIEEVPGECAKTVEVGRQIPARRFAGGMFSWFNAGYLHATNGQGTHRLALNSHYDYLRGRGAWAIGGRIGANIALGASHMMFSFPTSVLGYWGVPRISFYAGGGYTHARDNESANDEVIARRRLHGIHALAGTRILLRENRSTRISASFELYRTYFGDFTTTSITYNTGLHF